MTEGERERESGGRSYIETGKKERAGEGGIGRRADGKKGKKVKEKKG
jgi:hypothetical protein